MPTELTLSLHLKSFPENTEERQEFHLVEVHQAEVSADHRELHLSAPQHGFKKGVVKA